jgi:hypothetical protein
MAGIMGDWKSLPTVQKLDELRELIPTNTKRDGFWKEVYETVVQTMKPASCGAPRNLLVKLNAPYEIWDDADWHAFEAEEKFVGGIVDILGQLAPYDVTAYDILLRIANSTVDVNTSADPTNYETNLPSFGEKAYVMICSHAEFIKSWDSHHLLDLQRTLIGFIVNPRVDDINEYHPEESYARKAIKEFTK